MVMAEPGSILTLSAFFQPTLSATTALTVQGFQELPQSSYPLVQWVNIFKFLEEEAL